MKGASKGGRDILIPEEAIMSKIILIRGQKVMISNDLAVLYGVTTKRLNEQVKRNIKRFPHHFMFQLTDKEKDKVFIDVFCFKLYIYCIGFIYFITEILYSFN